MQILTHRGLDPDIPKFPSESSVEAFQQHIKRGYGLECDLNFTADDQIAIHHDSTIARLTNQQDSRPIREMSFKELQHIFTKNTHHTLCTIEDIATLIGQSRATIHAFHFKGLLQQGKNIDILIAEFKKYSKLFDRMLLFDLLPDIASYIKRELQTIHLAPSVAHPYDKQRFNNLVSGTLLTVDEAIQKRNIFDWVWLDEWDRKDANNTEKTFYTRDVFDELKKVKYSIGLVTPELHATSPGLIERESHEDAIDTLRLFQRITEIMMLQPDALCTDHPDKCKEIYDSIYLTV
ncbi:hypothetical protein BH09PAT2_BH09PAT2_10680 [soil metagenome]